MKRGILSVIEIVPIYHDKKEWVQFNKIFFTDKESNELSIRHKQTTAGFLALKKSVIKLLALRFGINNLKERDIVLAHAENGAPVLVSLPLPHAINDKVLKMVNLSITHTRDYAYGLSVIQENRDIKGIKID
jgi:phosphopantetheinyl transferase (holo-ACP synthase)